MLMRTEARGKKRNGIDLGEAVSVGESEAGGRKKIRIVDKLEFKNLGQREPKKKPPGSGT